MFSVFKKLFICVLACLQLQCFEIAGCTICQEEHVKNPTSSIFKGFGGDMP